MSKDSFCSYCGSVVPPNVAFCPNCGSPLKSTVAPTQTPQPSIPREDQPSAAPIAPPQPAAPMPPAGPRPSQPYIAPPSPQPLTQQPPGYSQQGTGGKIEIPIISTVGDGVNFYLSNFFKIFIPFLLASLVAQGLVFILELVLVPLGLISIGLAIPWLIVIGIISGVLNGMVGGIIVHESAEIYLNEKRETTSYQAASARKWDLFMGSIIYSIGVVVGLVALIIPGLYIMAKYALWQPAVMLESDSGNGIGRSGELTENNRWEIFAVIVVIALIQALVTGIFSPLAVGSPYLAFGLDAILNALVGPLPVVTATLIYYRLQGR